MRYINNILGLFNNYSNIIDNVSRILVFFSPTKNNWTSLGQPTPDCPVYAYRERLDGGQNQIPVNELSTDNQKEISDKLDNEFGSVK